MELHIDTGNAERNKQIVDGLLTKKDLVEKAFGEALMWDRLDEKRASRVRYVTGAGGLKDGQESWSGIQNVMINAMVRLAKAVKLIFGKGTA